MKQLYVNCPPDLVPPFYGSKSCENQRVIWEYTESFRVNLSHSKSICKSRTRLKGVGLVFKQLAAMLVQKGTASVRGLSQAAAGAKAHVLTPKC